MSHDVDFAVDDGELTVSFISGRDDVVDFFFWPNAGRDRKDNGVRLTIDELNKILECIRSNRPSQSVF